VGKFKTTTVAVETHGRASLSLNLPPISKLLIVICVLLIGICRDARPCVFTKSKSTTKNHGPFHL